LEAQLPISAVGIHQQRAVAIGCTCLAAAFGSTKLKPPESIREQLDQRHYNAHRDLAETLGLFLENAGPTARPDFF